MGVLVLARGVRADSGAIHNEISIDGGAMFSSQLVQESGAFVVSGVERRISSRRWGQSMGDNI